MNNVTPIKPESIADRAARELAAENADKALGKMKDLLRRRQAAEAVLKNIDREIEDYTQQIEQGLV